MAGKTKPEGLGGSRIDPQPKRVTTDVALNEVSPDSAAAAFVFDPADLEARRARRAELQERGDVGPDASRLASHKAELAAAKVRLAKENANVEAIEASIADLTSATKSSKSGDTSDDTK